MGALSPAKGPQPKEMPNERGESEAGREEYGILKREWEVYDAIPKMIKIRKEKGAAAKVSRCSVFAYLSSAGIVIEGQDNGRQRLMDRD